MEESSLQNKLKEPLLTTTKPGLSESFEVDS